MFRNSKIVGSIAILGMALVSLAVGLCIHSLESGRATAEQNVQQEVKNLSISLEHNLTKTIDDLDRILHFLISIHRTFDGKPDWKSVVTERFAVDEQAVQIAITDATGNMITSSAMPVPKTPIDLSDREHFRVHLNTRAEFLYISKPVLGRATGKWSVQFTRKLLNRAGEFDGIVVISLDPGFLGRSYRNIHVGSITGLAITSQDGTILSGSGPFTDQINKPIQLPVSLIQQRSRDLQFLQVPINSMPMVVSYKTLDKTGLSIVVTSTPYFMRADWIQARNSYLLFTVLFIIGVVIVLVTLVRSHKAHEQMLVFSACHDPLTSLLNRLGFNDALQRATLTPGAKMVAVHLIDLDRFKTVNDTFGHHVGDKLIVEAAKRLRKCIRSDDLLARLGGDEFAIIQLCSHQDDVDALGERICTAMIDAFTIDDRRLFVTASVGTSVQQANRGGSEDLLMQADLAMYAAKDSGRNTYRLFNTSMGHNAKKRLMLEDDLRNAISRGEFEIHYQPICRTANRAISGFEALLRWRHPKMGFVPAVDFIKVAEQSGLIVDIGLWVLENACREFSTQTQFDKLAINCSPAQFSDGGFADHVKRVIASTGLDPRRLELEITESILLENDTSVIEQFRTLRDIGVRISIDDFGTGYSCLSYLDKYPVDVIKIDKSFIEHIGTKRSSISIIRAVVDIAKSLNISTIAEGIEDIEQLEILRLIGCTEVQGFLLGRAKPLADWLPQAVRLDRVA